ncbi:tetratricopeptide repeat protein [Pseudoxanthomonas mexicana]|uniref:tetratricopeptide repeat protein n=1 Tax=Pseudoxanthomonas mexicana TaxID=128785 RepID=UPI001FD65071|nr:tetratricopeptide repeat protein [Pseudoxanthomonas mexicana]UOV02092.1 tetratricopeptide repeat protein [Pseudoxanthomonas mexicana]
MTTFVILAIVLSVAVLLAVLWPLWRDARGLVLAGVATLGVATFALYRVVGTPAALEPQATAAMPTTLEEAIGQLEAELKKKPNEPEGWRLLGKSYAALQRYGDAQKAFERAVQLMPDDADLLVEAAQARLFNNAERKLDAQAREMLDKAIAINPDHQRARWFVGLAQRQEGRHAEAAKTWEPLLAKVDPNTAATLRTQINEARAEAGLPPLADAAPVADASPALLTVTVDLAPALKEKLAPDDTLFVFARQVGAADAGRRQAPAGVRVPGDRAAGRWRQPHAHTEALAAAAGTTGRAHRQGQRPRRAVRRPGSRRCHRRREGRQHLHTDDRSRGAVGPHAAGVAHPHLSYASASVVGAPHGRDAFQGGGHPAHKHRAHGALLHGHFCTRALLKWHRPAALPTLPR